MKIMHISRTMGQGGAEKIVYQLCTDLKEFEQIVLSTGGEYTQILEEYGIKHYEIPDIDKKTPFLMLKTIYLIYKIAKKEKVDIIHSHHRMAAFYAKIVCLLMKYKRLYTAHNVFLDKRFLLRYALKGSAIVSVGDGVKDNLINIYKIKEEEISVIYNSISIEKIGLYNEELNRLKINKNILIGLIGRITEQKGVDIFLEGLQQSSKKIPNLVGIVVGDGEDRLQMESYAQTLGIKDFIYFLGYQKNILDIISQLDFVVLPSRWEGLPLIPIEVFSQGKTIIATNIVGNNEIIKDHYNGLLFPKDNSVLLSKMIIELILNENLKAELENGAKDTYDKKYQYSLFLEKYKNMYQQLLNIETRGCS